jgi:thiol:disulfide interchange protein DsbD
VETLPGQALPFERAGQPTMLRLLCPKTRLPARIRHAPDYHCGSPKPVMSRARKIPQRTGLIFQFGPRIGLTALLLSALCGPAHSAQSAEVVTPHLRASLVGDTARIEPGRPFWVALRFEIVEGWHTYWQNAGDSGDPPRIRWTLPEGFSASDIHWPYPQRLPVGPLMNYGYSGEAWMLVRVAVPVSLAAGRSVTLRAEANWLVCKVECIPEAGTFELSLPVAEAGQGQASVWAGQFTTMQQRLPQPSPWPVRFIAAANDLQLQLDLPGPEAARLDDAYFFPFQYGIVEHAAPQSYSPTESGLLLKAVRGDLRGRPLERLMGVLLLTEQLPDGPVARAFSIDAGAAAGVLPHLALVFAFAILGGLLLNVMPCVFPILSLKALSLVEGAAQAPGVVRRNGYVFTLGVLSSFAVIAAGLFALRAGGEAVGWGFQLQSPAFVLALAWLMFALGLMFSGLWSIGAGWAGVGQALASRPGSAGAFFTGVLAVIVATPCTAPFMGTALGYAITQPAWLSVSVFMALGLGMALPWLLISHWQGLSDWLPRPGPWMERVKQALAFPLYATAAWLLWVFAQQTSQAALLPALLSLVAIALALWLRESVRGAAATGRLAAWIGMGVLALALASVMWRIEPAATTSATSAPAAPDWERYDAARLAEARAAGRPVLVNFTAAWCITCLVNERVALSSPELRARLLDRNVLTMKGDWTRRDPGITRVLEQYGRSGVPLYLLFPRDPQRPAIVLPNILTEGIVIDALQRLD